ncbi:MAG: hypothetical protein RI958_2740 [Actinomycetota bacterium]|jgi:hypothetical protein
MQQPETISDSDVPDGELLEYLDDRRFDVLFAQGERRGLGRGEAIRTALVTLWKLDRFRLRR